MPCILPGAMSNLPKKALLMIGINNSPVKIRDSRMFDRIEDGDKSLPFCTFQIFGYKNFTPDSILFFAEMPDKLDTQSLVVPSSRELPHVLGMSQPNLFLFKNHLLEYTQKQRLPKPVYESVKEGLDHDPIFTATVIVNGERYDSPPSNCSRNLKAAQQAAARVAVEELCKEERNVSAGDYPRAVLDSGLCKNLLQEKMKKLNLPDPCYSWEKLGEEPNSTYEATVEIAGTRYIGGPAKSKKVAAIKAARTALLVIEGQNCNSNTERVDAHSGMKRERASDQPSGGQQDEMNKRRNAVARNIRDEQSHLQQEMCVDDGQEIKPAVGLSYQETGQKNEGEEIGQRTEEQVKQSRGEVATTLGEAVQQDEMTKKQDALATDLRDEQGHLEQKMCVDDGQDIKPVVGLSYQETGQKSEGEEVGQRTEEQVKQSRGEVVATLGEAVKQDDMTKTGSALAIDVRDEQSPLQQEMCVDDGQEIKPVVGLSYQETGQKSESEEIGQRTKEQVKAT